MIRNHAQHVIKCLVDLIAYLLNLIFLSKKILLNLVNPHIQSLDVHLRLGIVQLFLQPTQQNKPTQYDTTQPNPTPPNTTKQNLLTNQQTQPNIHTNEVGEGSIILDFEYLIVIKRERFINVVKL